MSDNNREERAPMVSQAMENVRRSGALSRRPGARRHRWTLAAPESPDSEGPGTAAQDRGEGPDQDREQDRDPAS